MRTFAPRSDDRFLIASARYSTRLRLRSMVRHAICHCSDRIRPCRAAAVRTRQNPKSHRVHCRADAPTPMTRPHIIRQRPTWAPNNSSSNKAPAAMSRDTATKPLVGGTAGDCAATPRPDTARPEIAAPRPRPLPETPHLLPVATRASNKAPATIPKNSSSETTLRETNVGRELGAAGGADTPRQETATSRHRRLYLTRTFVHANLNT
jgi:hypothetical protein